MKFNETIEQRARQTVRFTVEKAINHLGMMSTTARYPIKPKNFTLLELCQTFSEFHHPPPSTSSYQHQASLKTAQILTRRLYLHPLTINSNSKQQSSKISTTITSPDSEQPHQLNSDKNRETYRSKNKLSHRGLAVLSSSLPLITRINTKPDTRHSRDKISIHTDDDTISDCDVSTTTISLNQHSLPSIARGTLASTHRTCTRPSYMTNRRKTYLKSNRVEKLNVWHHLDRALQRPIPVDPPTTPLSVVSNFNIENNESQNHYLNYNSIQELHIYKRKPIHNLFIHEDENDDHYIYNK